MLLRVPLQERLVEHRLRVVNTILDELLYPTDAVRKGEVSQPSLAAANTRFWSDNLE